VSVKTITPRVFNHSECSSWLDKGNVRVFTSSKCHVGAVTGKEFAKMVREGRSTYASDVDGGAAKLNGLENRAAEKILTRRNGDPQGGGMACAETFKCYRQTG